MTGGEESDGQSEGVKNTERPAVWVEKKKRRCRTFFSKEGGHDETEQGRAGEERPRDVLTVDTKDGQAVQKGVWERGRSKRVFRQKTEHKKETEIDKNQKGQPGGCASLTGHRSRKNIFPEDGDKNPTPKVE